MTDVFHRWKALLLVSLLGRLSVTCFMLQKLRYTTYKNTAWNKTWCKMCSVEQLTRSQSRVYTVSLNCSCVGLMQYRMVCTNYPQRCTLSPCSWKKLYYQWHYCRNIPIISGYPVLFWVITFCQFLVLTFSSFIPTVYFSSIDCVCLSSSEQLTFWEGTLHINEEIFVGRILISIFFLKIGVQMTPGLRDVT